MKNITNYMYDKITNDVIDLKDGLNPDNISVWYHKIIQEAKDTSPPWLVDKINVKQDPILPLKFNLDISKRTVRFFMMAVENNLEDMPYSTKLYFLKVQEIMTAEMDKSLV